MTSPETSGYNCIAWAAGDSCKWWWPRVHPFSSSYWPDEAPDRETKNAFKEAYRSLGYEECESVEPEQGYEKIAVYTDEDGRPTHAARQLQNGMWTSKCGELEDIEHELEGLEGKNGYGSVSFVMKRAVNQET